MPKLLNASSIVVVAAASLLAACSDDAGSPPVQESADAGGPVAPDPVPPTGDDAAAPSSDAGTDSPSNDAGLPTEPQIVGYAYSALPAEDESTPSATYAYNASGGDITIKRTGTGVYAVTFAGLALDGGIALVTKYDDKAGLCHWVSTAGSTVNVRCSEGGANTDSKFVVTMVAAGTQSGASILGYAYANDKTNASYEPMSPHKNNAVGGGAITATRSGVGTYAIEFAGLGGLDIGNVQVTPTDATEVTCSIFSWFDSKVNVRCFDQAGAAADSGYLVMLAGTKPGGTAKIVAHAVAEDDTNASYAPALSYNLGGGVVSAARSDTGTYAISFAGKTFETGTHVQVVSQGQGRACNVNGAFGSTIDLTCAKPTGGLADSKYGIVVLQ